MTLNEQQLEDLFVAKLVDLKYTHRPDIREHAALEKNFRDKFNAEERLLPVHKQGRIFRDGDAIETAA